MLKINNITKKYGNKVVLDNVTLEIKENKIVGILGENGSGKTTLLKMLIGATNFNSGSITLDGENISYLTNNKISYLPDEPFLYNLKSVKDAIKMFKYFFKDFDVEKNKKLLQEFKIEETSHISSLSKGNLEKLNLSLILSRKARLYVLDEPLAGVDILARKQILKTIINNMEENSSMLITTHLISDVESIFDEVVFIKNGVVSELFDVEKIRNEEQKSIEDKYIEKMG